MLNLIKQLFKWETKSTNFYPIGNEYNPFFLQNLTRTDYLNLYKGWAFSCVNIIANNTWTLDYHLLSNKKNKESVITHKYMELVDYNLLKEIVSYLQLTWSAYILKEKFWNRVDKLRVLRSDMMRLQDNINPLKPFIYTNWKWFTETYSVDDIIEINLFNPLRNYPLRAKWVSPMWAIALQVEMDQETITNNSRLLKNGATPKWTLTTEQDLDADKIARYESSWNNKYKWPDNAWKVAVLGNWLKLNAVWFSPKELDFVEGRRFTRDEVYAIFWVPKEIAGLLENSNLASAKVAETIFYRNTIMPIALLIETELNKQLFNWIWYFEFTNVVPSDKEEIRKDFESGFITLNEARRKSNYDNLVDWDKIKISDFLLTQVEVEQKETTKKDLNIDFSLLSQNIKAYVPWTEEFYQKKWEAKVKREDSYEEKLKKQLIKIFDKQEKDIIAQITKKEVKKPKWDTMTYLALYLSLTTDIFNEIVQEEWNEALKLAWVNELFKVWETTLNKWIKKNIEKFAKSVDDTTFTKLTDIINAWNEQWLWADQISKEVLKVFTELKTSRVNNIVRTEVIRASTEANIEAWVQSEVVEWKEWWTAKDERVCPTCWPMHWKQIELQTNFYNIWDKTPDWFKIAYDDVRGAPLHPSCRCFLIPTIKD